MGVGSDWEERVESLVRAGVDLVAVDTAHGHSKNVLDVVKRVRRRYPDLDLAAGNVATDEGTAALIQAGANVVKVAVGPGFDLYDARRLRGGGAADHGDWQLCQGSRTP